MIEKESVVITEDEAALYDRQIRLWGLDAQKRLRAARVLLIGLGGLGAEVAKNIVLSGVRSLTLLDNKNVTELDSCSQFLVSRDDVGKNRAEASLANTQKLNPMVEVTADAGDITDKDDTFLSQFDVVCATCCSLEQQRRLNQICHTNSIKFLSGDIFGFYGYMFADLNEHEFAEEVPSRKESHAPPVDGSGEGEPAAKKSKQSEEEHTKTVKKTVSFCRLETALSVDWGTDEMKKRWKRTPKLYFALRVFLEFRSRYQCDPDPRSRQGDMEKLAQIRDSVVESLNISKELIPDDFASCGFGELGPVCAVVGGIMGQEIIKAVSQKDAPHNNFFFFNGVDSTGLVDRIG